MSQLPAGQRIADRYVVVDSLGAGGMGVVYRARDEKLGRHVAVKMLPADRVGDAAARERLLREARAAANLEHPGIVRVYDVGETEVGDAFLVMELVRGRSVRQVMKAGAMNRPLALRIVEEVAVTLAAAHEAGLLHRDVKPDNIMVRDDGRVVLLDFGLVKSLGPALTHTATPDTPTMAELTRAGAILGTPAYLAPEQARGRSGPATDQWALAVVAFELLTGKVPWTTEHPTQLLAQILVDPAPSVSSSSDVPRAADSVFARALSKDPQARFDSPTDFAAAVRAALEGRGLPPSARAAPTTPPAASPDSPGPLRAGTGVLADAASVLACPMLEVAGVPEPSGWMGAAAASVVAERARWLLGGRAERVMLPAELLSLPTYPVESFPADPFDDPEARADTLTAAADMADAWVDGKVRRRGNAFQVSLRLVDASTRQELRGGRGAARALYAAVREAMEALVGEDGIPQSGHLDAAAAATTDVSDVAAALALCDFWLGHAEARTTEPARATALGAALGAARSFAAAAAGEAAELPPLDRSTPRGLVQTVIARHASIDGVRRPAAPPLEADDARALAAELSEVVASAEPAPLRSLAAVATCVLRSIAGDAADAHTAAVRAVQLDHRSRLAWLSLDWTSDLGQTQHLVFTGAAAWFPWDPYVLMSRGRTTTDHDLRLRLVRRAHALLPESALYASILGDALLETGAREEARGLAVAFSDGDTEQCLVSEALLARIEASEARFGPAYDRVVDALEQLPGFGSATGVDGQLAFLLRELAELLGRSEEASDLFLSLFVDTEPPRLNRVEQPSVGVVAALHCALATPARAERCARRLMGMGDHHAEAIARGALCYARGDWEGAASAFRPYAGSPNLWSMRFALVMSPAFERAGQPELAERVDRWMLANPGGFNGANLAHVRAARRAAARGDREEARRLARQVVDAWAASDPPVQVVAEMRTLLA